jgi:hypothetical protein
LSRNQDKYTLSLDTLITVTASKDNFCYIENMTFEQALNRAESNRNNGWSYKNYKLGYCAMKEKHK